MLSLPKKQPESWQDALKFMGRCPICNAEYAKSEARLFAKKDSANLVHINCSECRSAIIAMILILGQGLSSVGMVTDLSFDDAGRLFDAEALSLDEVIEGYQYIQTNNIFPIQTNIN